MATKTTNYNLTKPDLTDWADIRVLNNNMDIIDSAMKTISDLAGSGGGADIDLSAYALKSQLDGYLPLTGGNVTGKLTYNGKEVATVSTNKTGTTQGNEANMWKTYLPDGRVMMKITVGTQSHVTLPVVMANTQYSVIQCDNVLWDTTKEKENGQIVNRGIRNKSTTGFDVYSCKLVANATHYNNYWAMSSDNYIGNCDCIVIGWEV
nr:MAG TPA: hypothetical protein [Caudoviricetes sp.]